MSKVYGQETTQGNIINENGIKSSTGRGNWLMLMGPGIITAALVFGPSKITITSKLGAQYGYSLLWTVILAIFFMAVYTRLASKIALATDISFLSTVRQKWGRPVAVLSGIGVFLVTTSFQAGNSIGVGISLAEATGVPMYVWIIIFNLTGLLLLFFRGFYKVLEKLMIGLVLIMLTSFLITLFLVKPDISQVAGGFVPSVPSGSLTLVIALFASSFSIVGALYQSYMVQERRRLSPDIRQRSNDSLPGIIILGVMASVVLICAAAVLQPSGVNVTSASDMGKALEPLFGEHATYLFLTGLFGASFSSLIGNASVGGTLLGDALGYQGQLSSSRVRGLIAVVMTAGAIIAIAFGRLPLQLIVLAQSVTILIVPFLGIALFVISGDKKIMGRYASRGISRILAALGLLILIVLALINVKEMFF